MHVDAVFDVHFNGTKPSILHMMQKVAPREIWETGDYIVAQYIDAKGKRVDYLEHCDGTLHPLKPKDIVVGALGERCATQEVVGSWKLIDKKIANPTLDHICGSGMFGIESSRSKWHNVETSQFRYVGHCFRNDKKVCMRDFAPATTTAMPTCPIILIVGTSMSCGKTISGKMIIDIIKNDLGIHNVAGTKFTGGGKQ